MLKKSSSTGLDENIANFMAYLLGWVSGLILLLVEQNNASVRYHAAQSVVIFGGLTILGLLVPVLPVIGGVLMGLIGILSLGLWIVLMVTALMEKAPRLPFAEKLAVQLEQTAKNLLG